MTMPNASDDWYPSRVTLDDRRSDRLGSIMGEHRKSARRKVRLEKRQQAT
jgi:hypothetical protein